MPTKPKASILDRILVLIHRFEDSLLVIVLLAMIFLASLQIFMRNLFEVGFVWADPLLRVMVLWIGLLGALAASRDNKHITVDILSRAIPGKARHAIKIFTNLFTAVVTSIIAYHAGRFVIMEYESKSVVFANLPAWLFEIIIPISFTFMSVRYFIHSLQTAKHWLFAERSP